MVPSLADIVRRTSEQIKHELDVSMGLNKVVRNIEKADRPTQAVERAQRELRERARHLKAAEAKLEHLREAVRRIGEVLPYTAEGWEERREQLEAKLRRDPRDGLAEWISDWLTAASYCRFEAMRRLESVAVLPEGAAQIVERCISTRVGLEQVNYHLAGPLLEAGVDRLAVGPTRVPTATVAFDLELLRQRLLLAQGLLDEAGAALGRSGAPKSAPAAGALRARWRRLHGDGEAAREELEELSAMAPADMDVAAEVIETARVNGQDELAIDTARVAVSALPALVDIEAEIDRLVGSSTAELWTAVAERALGERDFRVHSLAVERAMALAPTGTALGAVVAQLRAQGAVERGLPDDELISAFLEAGIGQVLAGHPDLGREDFEQVLQHDPDHSEAKLRLADCLITEARLQPLKGAREPVQRGLDLIESVRTGAGIRRENSWSYLSAAAGHERLCGGLGDDARRHGWHGLLAACRAVVHQPEASSRWLELSSAAQTLNLPETALACAAGALALDPEDAGANAQYVQALTNSCRFDEALERLGDPAESWARAVKAYVLLRQNDVARALVFMESASPDPNWGWASMTLVSALVLSDRPKEAQDTAQGLYDWWVDRTDEEAGASVMTWASIVLGHYASGEAHAARLPEPEASSATGVARLLRGDREGAIASLHTGVRTATARQELSELVRIVLPLARSLARQRGVATPDLSPIETAVEHRDHELGAVTDAFAELRLATVGESDADVTPLAGAMCAALLHQGRGDAGAGLAALEAVAEHQASDAELTALRERLAEQAQADAVARADERASAGDGAATDPRAAANSYLSAAVKSFASTASSLLEEPRVIEAWLPPSWFDGHDDPLQDHALFLRHIPEVRARADWEVPRINVRTDSELEPDRYRIVKGDATELGRAAPGHRYGTREAFALLGLEAELAPEAWGLRRLPEGVVSAAGDLGGLVTMDELEVVASRMSNIARPGTDGDRRRWPRRVAAALSRAVLAKSGSPAST